MLGARPAAAAIAAWSMGLVLYLAVMVLVVARLLLAGLRPGDAMAPYWVAMGAAALAPRQPPRSPETAEVTR